MSIDFIFSYRTGVALVLDHGNETPLGVGKRGHDHVQNARSYGAFGDIGICGLTFAPKAKRPSGKSEPLRPATPL